MAGVKAWVLVVGGALVLLVIGAFWLASRALVGQLADSGPQRLAEPDPAFLAASARNATVAREVVADTVAQDAGAVANERVLLFKDDDALAEFLGQLPDGLRVLGVIGPLRAVRVGFEDLATLMKALADDPVEMYLYPVWLPPFPEGEVQAGAVALGAGLLEWLGVGYAEGSWGQGVKIAVLDTGVVPDAGLGKVSRFIELVPSAGDLSLQNGHGTAVASLIIGQTQEVPGLAPGAELISVRVADDLGYSNSFLLAQGIIEAVDAGAELINISMGGFAYSELLQQAVDYAVQHGALVVAAAGNNGIAQVQYPAALDGVVGVGAVDALGQHLDFSNSGAGVDVAAPGLGVHAHWLDGELASVSGTSFSTPIVTGTLAAVMTSGASRRLSPLEAWELMARYFNDAGLAGPDEQLGGGMPDLGRILAGGQPGIYDAALASMRLVAADGAHPYGQVELLVQNRGTETLLNTGLNVEIGGVLQRGNLSVLEPGAVQAIRVPVIRPVANGLPQQLQVLGRVGLSNGQLDAKPINDSRILIQMPGD